MSLEPSSRLQAAEALLFMLEDAQSRIRNLRSVPTILQDIVESAPGMIDIPKYNHIDRSPEKPPIRTPEANPIAYEEQLTQAIDPEQIDTLDADINEPPVRHLMDPPEYVPTDVEERAEGRARSAAKIREAKHQAETNEKRAENAAKDADDSIYRDARDQGVAAIQLTTEGSARMVRKMVAIGEAMEEDVAREPDRSAQAHQAGGLRVDVLIPEVEIDVDENLPELTDSALSAFTQDQIQIKDKGDPSLIAKFLAQAQNAERRADLTEAITAYSDALDVNGELDIAWLGRGRCRIEQGDYTAALSDLKHAQVLNPQSSKPILQMGHLHYARKAYDQALHYYDEVVSRESQNALALAKRGLCYHYLEQTEAAVSDLELAMAIEPENAKIRRCLEMTQNPSDHQG